MHETDVNPGTDYPDLEVGHKKDWGLSACPESCTRWAPPSARWARCAPPS